MEIDTAEGERVYPVNHFIREWRNRESGKHLTVNKLAELSGLSPSMISKLERGLVQYTEGTLAKIAPVLGTTPAMLIAINPKKSGQIWEFLCEYIIGPAEFALVDEADKNILLQSIEMHCRLAIRLAQKSQHLPGHLMPDYDFDFGMRREKY